jgi:hypothetical protein
MNTSRYISGRGIDQFGGYFSSVIENLPNHLPQRTSLIGKAPLILEPRPAVKVFLGTSLT